MGKYQNPADLIIKMAQVPERCNETLSIGDLFLDFEQK